MAYVKKFVKRAAGKVKAAVKKRYIKNGQPKLATMARDIVRLKTMLNTEKHMVTTTLTGGYVGRVTNITGQGYLSRNISPNIAQGVGETNRIGAKIKIVSFQFRCLISQNGNASGPIRWTHYLVRQPVSAHDLGNDGQLNRFIQDDPFFAKKCYFSMRNPDGNDFKLFTIISKRSGVVNADSAPGVIQNNVCNIYKKSQFHVKWSGDETGIGNITQNPIYSIWVADNGDVGTPGTGLMIQEMVNWYYVDN